MRRYYTGLFPFSEEVRGRRKVCQGAGWRARIERSAPELSRRFCDPKEIVIYSGSFSRAQAALSLILDAFTVLNGGNWWSDDFVAIPADKAERAKCIPNPRDMSRSLSTATLWEACAVAALASRTKRLAYALALYRLSAYIHANQPMDLDPGNFPYEHRSSNLRDQVRFAYAIVTAYAVIETLGCALHQEAFCDGKWVPDKRREIESRLTSLGVNLEETLVWHVRGSPTKLEAARTIPAVRSAPWFRHPIRDLEVNVVEAIAYLRWLRARAGAHDVTKMAYLLSIHDVANAQSLARRLLSSTIRKKGQNKSLQATAAAPGS
jgi:hypothetical protein